MNNSEAARVGAYEAKTRLPALLDRVQRGEEIVITRHGQPVARLVPEGGEPGPEAALAALDRLTRSREELAACGTRFTAAEIRTMLEEERRER
jgi:prevent-host-death family protein